MKTKIDIISGFLGSGKTTFIKKMINDIYEKENVVILENEFGKVNIDQDTLKREGLKVKPIQAGCICCTGSGDLLAAVKEIIEEYHPERIIIEPTGIARLSDVRGILKNTEMEGLGSPEHIVTIVDAKNYYKRVFVSKEFFENQIYHSDVIFLSKTDDMKAEEVKGIVESIEKVQPLCHIITESWDHISPERLKETIALKQKLRTKPLPVKITKKHANDFETYEIETEEFMEVQQVKLFLDDVEKGTYGQVHRVKGICRDKEKGWYSLDYVPGEKIFKLFQEKEEEKKESRICLIGRELNREELDKMFLS